MLKDGLARMADSLKELEGHARKLQNQNFADIVQAAHRRVAQLTQHPDIDEVHKHMAASGEAGPSQDAGPFPV